MSYIGGNQNTGYAASNAGSAVPPGMGYNNMNYNQSQNPHGFNPNQNQQINVNKGGGCDCAGWLSEHNPFKLANNVGPDIMYAARYKQAMGLGLASILVTAVAAIIGLTFNFIPVLHLIPIMLPCCHKGASPFWWSLISIGSVGLGGVSLLFELFGNEAAEGSIFNSVVILIELVNLFVLSRMDGELKSKVRNCFAECGCCGTQAQLQTMVPQESAYQQSPTQINMAKTYQQPPPGPPGLGSGSIIGGGGSVVSGPGYNNNYQGSYAGGNPGYAGSQAGYNNNNYNDNYNNNYNGNGGGDDGQHNWNMGGNPMAVGNRAYDHRRRSYDSAQTARQKQTPTAKTFRPTNFSTLDSRSVTSRSTAPPLPPNKPNANVGHYLDSSAKSGPRSVTGTGGPQRQKRKSRKVHARNENSMEFEGMSDLNYTNENKSELSAVSEKGSLIFNAIPMFEAEGRNFLRDSPPV